MFAAFLSRDRKTESVLINKSNQSSVWALKQTNTLVKGILCEEVRLFLCSNLWCPWMQHGPFLKQQLWWILSLQKVWVSEVDVSKFKWKRRLKGNKSEGLKGDEAATENYKQFGFREPLSCKKRNQSFNRSVNVSVIQVKAKFVSSHSSATMPQRLHGDLFVA